MLGKKGLAFGRTGACWGEGAAVGWLVFEMSRYCKGLLRPHDKGNEAAAAPVAMCRGTVW